MGGVVNLLPAKVPGVERDAVADFGLGMRDAERFEVDAVCGFPVFDEFVPEHGLDERGLADVALTDQQ